MQESKTITITNGDLLSLTRALNGYVEYTSNVDKSQLEPQQEFITFVEEVYEIFEKAIKKYSKTVERLNFKYGVKDTKTNRLVLDQFGNFTHTEESLNSKLNAIEELEEVEVELEIPTLSNEIMNFLPLEFKIAFKKLNSNA
jgi:hypothetical protein